MVALLVVLLVALLAVLLVALLAVLQADRLGFSLHLQMVLPVEE